jgi:transposase InsO family protein
MSVVVCGGGSRRIAGFALADRMRTDMVASALDMAVRSRGGQVTGMVFTMTGAPASLDGALSAASATGLTP